MFYLAEVGLSKAIEITYHLFQEGCWFEVTPLGSDNDETEDTYRVVTKMEDGPKQVFAQFKDVTVVEAVLSSQGGKEMREYLPCAYYVRKEGDLYVLRQPRYKVLLLAGKEHPHDVCAIGRTEYEIRRMAEMLKGATDYSEIEQGPAVTAQQYKRGEL